MYTGKCLCGQVRYEFDSNPTDVSVCHCSFCRRMTGTAFGVYVKVPGANLQLASGNDNLNSYDVTGKLSMLSCRTCGSYVYATHSDYSEFAYVCLGTLDDDHDIRPGYHEFVGSKANWFEIHDSLPRFEDWSPDDQ